MKAYFFRKLYNFTALEEETHFAEGLKQRYEVTRTVELEAKDFREFTSDFLADQTWLNKREGGVINGVVQAIRVVNKANGQAILVNPEGYQYPRYTAIE